jgi:hypothetical protein
MTSRSTNLRRSAIACAFLVSLVPLGARSASAQETNIHSLPSDLMVPPAIRSAPEPGLRVLQRRDNLGPNEFALYHAVYLPPEWKPGEKYPVLVEYPGNGGYKNALGDVSTGRLEDCKLGYGISGGKGMIWVCLPFVDKNRHKQVLNWWGDPDETAAYCREVVDRMCRYYGGDRERVILCGFSRGAIACNYIGLRDDATAKLWRAFIPHSHYDGVRRWGQPEDDDASAAKRLARMKGRPQFITHEKSIDATEAYLRRHDALAGTTLVPLPYPNHSDEWVLKDIPERKRLRAWLAEVLK